MGIGQYDILEAQDMSRYVMFVRFKHQMPIHLAVSSSENNSGNESFGLIEPDNWHLSDHIDDSPMMRGQSLPTSNFTASEPVPLQVHEGPEEELDTESSGDSQMLSDQHQPDEVWREYHPLLTGKRCHSYTIAG